jgi:hypothetical protein
MLPSGRKWGFGRLKRLAIKISLEARSAFLRIQNLESLILITRKIVKFREFCASETREEIISRMRIIFHFLHFFILFDGITTHAVPWKLRIISLTISAFYSALFFPDHYFN